MPKYRYSDTFREMWNNGDMHVLYNTLNRIGEFYFPYGPEIHDLPIVNIGCGTVPMDGWINADIIPAPHVDEVFDCEKEWPFETDSLRILYASHLLEHLDDVMAFLDEAHRCLHPLGSMVVRVPHSKNTLALAELDHRRALGDKFFQRLMMGGNEKRDLVAMKRPWSNLWMPKIMIHLYEKDMEWLVKLPLSWQKKIVTHMWDICGELAVWLRPL